MKGSRDAEREEIDKRAGSSAFMDFPASRSPDYQE